MSPSGKGVDGIVRVRRGLEVYQVRGHGNGPVAAFVHGLNESRIVEPFEVVSYSEHSLGAGSEAKAVGLLRDQDRLGPDELRRGDRREHRDRFAQGDRERAEPADVGNFGRANQSMAHNTSGPLRYVHDM